MKNGWQTVSKSHPCPVCHKWDWCRVSTETGAVNCMRIASSKPVNNGGWMHGGPERPAVAPPRHKRVAVEPYEAPGFNAALWWQTARFVATWERMDPWAGRLGLPIGALDIMGACVLGDMLTFPMFDGHGEVCGIRTRDPDGSKRAVTGSRSGVFLPTFHNGAEPLVCEGPTDATAALALGYYPIGRPSCSGCERHVVDTCRRLGIARVTVCADIDHKPGKPGDRAGEVGARRLAETLRAARIGARLVTPNGHKDLRDWFRAGATQASIDVAWSQAEWR